MQCTLCIEVLINLLSLNAQVKILSLFIIGRLKDMKDLTFLSISMYICQILNNNGYNYYCAI